SPEPQAATICRQSDRAYMPRRTATAGNRVLPSWVAFSSLFLKTSDLHTASHYATFLSNLQNASDSKGAISPWETPSRLTSTSRSFQQFPAPAPTSRSSFWLGWRSSFSSAHAERLSLRPVRRPSDSSSVSSLLFLPFFLPIPPFGRYASSFCRPTFASS